MMEYNTNNNVPKARIFPVTTNGGGMDYLIDVMEAKDKLLTIEETEGFISHLRKVVTMCKDLKLKRYE